MWSNLELSSRKAQTVHIMRQATADDAVKACSKPRSASTGDAELSHCCCCAVGISQSGPAADALFLSSVSQPYKCCILVMTHPSLPDDTSQCSPSSESGRESRMLRKPLQIAAREGSRTSRPQAAIHAFTADKASARLCLHTNQTSDTQEVFGCTKHQNGHLVGHCWVPSLTASVPGPHHEDLCRGGGLCCL